MQEPLSLTYAKLREQLATAEIELTNAKAQMFDNLPAMPNIESVFIALSTGQTPPQIERPDPRIQAQHEREINEASMQVIRLKARLGAMEFAQRERLIAALKQASSLAGLFSE